MSILAKDFEGKSVLVVGSGKSGIGACKLLLKVGARPIMFDGNPELDIDAVKENNPEVSDIDFILENVPEELFGSLFMAVISPGVPIDSPLVLEFKSKNIPVWGEIELGYCFFHGKLVGITGTNGKTTTTTLVGDIMKAYSSKDNVFVVGNIGNPFTDVCLDTNDNSISVAEISSFQLETAYEFKPDVSAVLNITPDHLNRHHTMACYAETKEKIAANETKNETCVLNYEDPILREYAAKCPAKVKFFSSKRMLEDGIYLSGDDIVLNEKGFTQVLMNIHDMNLVGMCNVENVMAAILISKAMGVPMDIILSTVKSFKAVEHRIEFVATKNGVDYYNDSKGTNPDAAIQGIRAMAKPTVLIGGGYDKMSEYDEWIEAFDNKVKCFVLIGQTKEKIAECAKAHGIANVIMADTFEEAFNICVKEAKEGDAVLLSPACASWGMFPNYEVRGQMFKDMVNAL